jgi:hypothetical protein
MQAKLPVLKEENIKVGDTIKVQIVHIGDSRIVVERV